MQIKDSFLILRLGEVGHTPSTQYIGEILRERGYPAVALEVEVEQTGLPRALSFAPTIPTEKVSLKRIPFFPRSLSALFRLTFYLMKRISVDGKPRCLLATGLIEQLAAWVIGKRFQIPYVAQVHEISEASEVSLAGKLLLAGEGPTLRQARFIIMPDERRANLYRTRYGLENEIEVVANTPRKRATLSPKVSLAKRLGLPEALPTIGYVGGLSDHNGLSLALRSLSFSSHYSLIALGWGSESYQKQLLELARSLNVADRFRIVDVQADKWEWIDNFDLGLSVYLPSGGIRYLYLGTSSNKLFEFLSAGVPVIVYQPGDQTPVVTKYAVGIGVADDPKAFATTIDHFLQDRSQYLKFRDNARQSHLSDFHYEKQFEKALSRIASLFPTSPPKS